MRIEAAAALPAPAPDVFERLCDLDAHHGLAAPHIEVLALDGERGGRTGGLVRLNGPLGISMLARTRVRAARFPVELSGSAVADGGTTAELVWRLEPLAGRSVLRSELTVRPRRRTHRLLLAIGGRRWLRRRLTTAIERLAVR